MWRFIYEMYKDNEESRNESYAVLALFIDFFMKEQENSYVLDLRLDEKFWEMIYVSFTLF